MRAHVRDKNGGHASSKLESENEYLHCLVSLRLTAVSQTVNTEFLVVTGKRRVVRQATFISEFDITSHRLRRHRKCVAIELIQ